MPAVERLSIRRWGPLDDLAIEFGPGLNVLLGESGSGKSLCLGMLRDALLGTTGGPKPPTGGGASALLTDGTSVDLPRRGEPTTPPPDSLYLPVEWGTTVPEAIGPRSLSRQALVIARPAIELLRETLGGDTAGGGGTLTVRPSHGKPIPVGALGEGHRRLALLHALLRTGTLRPGGLLLWDLPETGLSLSLLTPLARVLLTLAHSECQVIVATHSYVLCKELSLAAHTPTEVRYHLLAREQGSVEARSFPRYDLIDPNPPLEAHGRLYDRALRRALGGD